jgi:tRNA-splicing endonuclease subunit Sen2
MIALHNMGFFGKGSLSRGNPEFAKERQQIPPFVRHWQWERRCTWAKQMKSMMHGIETKQKDTVKVSCEEDCIKEVQITSEITGTVPNQTYLEPRASVIPDTRTQEKNSKKACGITSTVLQYDAVKTNWIVENSNSSDDNSVKNTCSVVNTDEHDCAEVNGSSTVKNQANVDKTFDSKSNEHEQNSTTEINNLSNTDEQNRNRSAECCKGNATIVTSENCSTEEGGVEEYNQSLADRSERRMLLVLPESDSDYEGYLNNACPRLEEEQFHVRETLHLTLEEAFFLSFGLGCLQVIDLFGNCLSLDGMWQLFCKSQKDFIQKYVTYHYFRSKGWVVKTGIKFGGDFLLYKQGPPFYHASYIVLVEVIDKSTLMRIRGLQRSLSWTRLMGLNRVGESAGKEILFCQVIWPSEASPESMGFPSILSKLQVHEVLIRRWISSQEREESDVS